MSETIFFGSTRLCPVSIMLPTEAVFQIGRRVYLDDSNGNAINGDGANYIGYAESPAIDGQVRVRVRGNIPHE